MYTKYVKNNDKSEDVTLDTLARMMADGFASLEGRFDDVDGRLYEVEARLEGFNRRLDTMADTLTPMEQLTKLITKDVLGRLERVEKELFDK